jgi:hypothetical protein
MRQLLLMTILQLILMQQLTADDSLGRLFFTPEQRQNLERLRNDKQHESTITEPEAYAVNPSLAILPESNIQGYVKSSDGQQSTQWVNGKPLQDDEIE